MPSQWEYLLKNLGEWHGSFTRLSPKGKFIEDTPTIVSLEGQDNNTKIHQVVRRLPPGQPPQDLVLDYSSLSRSILFFENGAFSQGSMQWGPFSEFGAEFGLIEGDRRLRLVMVFNADSQFDKLTLIREKLAGSNAPERPLLTVDQLLGEWQGEAVTIYPDFRPSDTYSTRLQVSLLDRNRLEQRLTFGDRAIASTATITGSILHFDRSDPPVQILLLPDGASCNCPVEIKPRQRFVLEVGWLVSPTQRQRIIRSYGDKGEWVSLTLVREEKR
ncbi:hypothetical protein NIES593_16280 [Hydrococcus rivularis NIES-593]|uniref:Uncharacterized protein n=1 Tax=Hydrococcus rivularis NIES-593 TaxID=1921803 RepID=A0A1U7HC85_9CYAN|nr:DUF3598 family protein [Hydrococcus rivularis]OKH21174.1 hypothetical protein NIES593_16280 [Hydrococcus rivularis NIES-593]